jgi:hypothetical protein
MMIVDVALLFLLLFVGAINTEAWLRFVSYFCSTPKHNILVCSNPISRVPFRIYGSKTSPNRVGRKVPISITTATPTKIATILASIESNTPGALPSSAVPIPQKMVPRGVATAPQEAWKSPHQPSTETATQQPEPAKDSVAITPR